MAKFCFYVSTGKVGSSKEEIVEIDDKELEGMTEYEKHEYIWKEYYMIWVQENAELSFWEIKEDNEIE